MVRGYFVSNKQHIDIQVFINDVIENTILLFRQGIAFKNTFQKTFFTGSHDMAKMSHQYHDKFLN